MTVIRNPEHPDEGACERAVLAAAGLVGQDRGVEVRADAPPFAVKLIGKLKPRAVAFGAAGGGYPPTSGISTNGEPPGPTGRRRKLGAKRISDYCLRQSERRAILA